MRSTPPVDLSLRASVDPSSIVATARYLLSREESLSSIRAYSWTFDELPDCDERHISDIIASHYDIPADHLWPLKDYPKTNGGHNTLAGETADR